MRKRKSPRREVDDWGNFRKTPHVDDVETQQSRKPLLRRPMRSDEEKDARRRLQLPNDARQERRRRKSVRQRERPPLSKSVESFRFASVAPGEEAREMRRRRRREEDDVWTPEAATDATKNP